MSTLLMFVAAASLPGRPQVLVVGDLTAHVAAGFYLTDQGFNTWRTIDLSSVPGWPLPAHDSQLEGIAVDGGSLVALMREDPRLEIAAAFYLVYIAGVIWFASMPAVEANGDWRVAARDGALLGLLAYGTYECVNMATLKGWTWRLVAVDVVWGTALTGGAAAVGVLLFGAF